MKFLIFFFFLNSIFAQSDFDFSEEEFTLDTTEELDFSEVESETFDLLEPEKETANLEEGEEGFEDIPLPLEPSKKLSPKKHKTQASSRGAYIYHPNQEKGLYKINRNSEYLYKYEKTTLTGVMGLKFGQLNLKKLVSDTGTYTFEDIYERTTAPSFMLEYHWSPFKKMPSLAISTGGGVGFVSGQGRFLNPNAGRIIANEKYTFVIFPLYVGATYFAKFINDPLFLPYISAALSYNVATEFRESFKNFKYAGIPGSHLAVGLNINLGWLERSAAIELDQDFGINNTYLTIEFRSLQSFKKSRDVSGTMITAGFNFEF